LAGPAMYVHAVAFSPDGRTLATGSGDGSLRIYEARPLHERVARAKHWQRLRDEQRERLLAIKKPPKEVAAAIRADTTLSADQREAALQVLLEATTNPER
jgi:WD40 repeat protein